MALVCKCIVVASAIISAISLEPVEEGLDWEDFEVALREDGAEDAISLLQTRVTVKRTTVAQKLVNIPQDSLKLTKPLEETLDRIDDLLPYAFSDTLQSEEMAPEGISLVQTDAHIERMGTPGQADQTYKPQDGMMHVSVGGDGSILAEEQPLFLFQTDAQTNRVTVVTEADGTNVVARNPQSKGHTVAVDQDNSHGEDANAGVSLLQVAFQPPSDVALLGAEKPTAFASNENQHLADQSRIQAEVAPKRVHTPMEAHKLADDLLADGEKAPGALSLLQADVHIESKHTTMITEADGSNVELIDGMQKPHQTSTGMMQVSVSADGRLR